MDGAGSGSAGEGGDFDDEPVLKYQRMGADVGRLLSAAANDVGGKDTVVRMAVHDTCLVSPVVQMKRGHACLCVPVCVRRMQNVF